MAILVARPGAQGQELCQQLNNSELDAIHFPLLDLVANPLNSALLDSINKADIIIAVSQPAVTYCDQYLQQQNANWPSNALYLAIGQKTAWQLSKNCQQDVNYPKLSDSEHFVQLPELKKLTSKNIVILRGNGGREFIKHALEQQGAIVTYGEVYQRHYVSLPSACFTHWRTRNITTIVMTSGEQLAHFVTQTPNDHLTWLFSLRIVIPSQRIEYLARELGFIHITTAHSASNTDLLAALQPLRKTGHKHDK